MTADFEIVGDIRDVERMAVGRSIHELRRLTKAYGGGRWRKFKGTARVRLPGHGVRQAELHWYEAHGVGRREFKIKRLLD